MAYSLEILMPKFSILAFVFLSSVSLADDWPMRGQNRFRSSSVESENGPQIWQPKIDRFETIESEKLRHPEARVGRVKWMAGGFWEAMCDPVVANGLLWIGTGDPIGESTDNFSVLACFDAQNGKLLFQHISKKLGIANQDWPGTGNTSSPFIDGNRLWFCTNRLEVICLNIQPLVDRTGDPTVIWTVDLKSRYGMVPKDVHLGNRASRCSIVGVDGRIFVNTTNSRHYDRTPAVDPNAPSLVCLNQDSGESIWTDNSPGLDIARNQHCNPVIFQNEHKSYVAIGQGDAFVRAFECETGIMGWQFDVNTKQERQSKSLFKKKRLLTESPVFDGRNLYFAIGEDREASFERGGIYCIDPFGSGDVSRQLIVDGQTVPNPNSKWIWEHSEKEGQKILSSIAGLCVTSKFLFAADIDGSVKCFDKLTGKLHWLHDTQSTVIGTPLVVGDSLYVTDEEGDVDVLRASENYELIGSMNHGSPIESSPIYAEGTLFIVTRRNVYAIGK